MRIMVTCGGTAGHTSPAVAVIEELRRRDPLLEVQWVGCKGAIEERVARSLAIPFRPVPVEGWPRGRWNPRRAIAAAKLAVALAQSVRYIRRFRPQIVVGFGGYVSVPVLLAAQRLGVPTALHEANKRMGLANRLAAKRANRIFLSYDDTIGPYARDRAAVTGNPVRAGFVDPPGREEACKAFGLDPSVPVVLITGGSQGAQSINRAAAEALPHFESGEVQFIWLAGKRHANEARKAAAACRALVAVYSFLDDMPAAFAAADLAVSRAGASSTAEIAAIGKPSILVPFPHATDNHQDDNARAFVEKGAARILDDAACTGPVLGALIRELLENPAEREAMSLQARSLARTDAASRMAGPLLELAFGRDAGSA